MVENLTAKELISFGNYLLTVRGTKSEVLLSDLESWGTRQGVGFDTETNESYEKEPIPSHKQPGEQCTLQLPNDTFVNATVRSVEFMSDGKRYFNLDVVYHEGSEYERVVPFYNVPRHFVD